MLSSIFSNFFPTVPNIPYQTSCYPIYIILLLYISLATVSLDFPSYSSSLSISLPLHIVPQIPLLIPVYFLSFPLVPKYLLLLYNLSIVLSTNPFL